MSTNRHPILFRCDGTPSAGWESFYQCHTLAGALQRRRRGTYFSSLLEPTSVPQAVTRSGNEWFPAEHPVGTADDLTATLRQVRKHQAAAVVVACPAPDPEYLRGLRDEGVLVVSVDSEGGFRTPADLVVNPFLAPPRPAYEAESKRTQFLVGEKYALIRPLARRMRPVRATEPPQPFRALVAMGEDDPAEQAAERAEQLLSASRAERVDVAVRSHSPQLDRLKELAAQSEGRLEVVTEPAEVSARFARCHVALTCGDNWSLEMACLGVPQLMLAQTDRHARNAERLDEEGVGRYLGEATSVSDADLRDAVNDLLGNAKERSSMARTGRKLIDARGPDRLVNAIEIMLHAAPVQPVRLAA